MLISNVLHLHISCHSPFDRLLPLTLRSLARLTPPALTVPDRVSLAGSSRPHVCPQPVAKAASFLLRGDQDDRSVSLGVLGCQQGRPPAPRHPHASPRAPERPCGPSVPSSAPLTAAEAVSASSAALRASAALWAASIFRRAFWARSSLSTLPPPARPWQSCAAPDRALPSRPVGGCDPSSPASRRAMSSGSRWRPDAIPEARARSLIGPETSSYRRSGQAGSGWVQLSGMPTGPRWSRMTP